MPWNAFDSVQAHLVLSGIIIPFFFFLTDPQTFQSCTKVITVSKAKMRWHFPGLATEGLSDWVKG